MSEQPQIDASELEETGHITEPVDGGSELTDRVLDDSSQPNDTENKDQLDSQDLESIKLVETAVFEALERMRQILGLSRDAMDSGRVTESIFRDDEEWNNAAREAEYVGRKMLDVVSQEEKMMEINKFIKWYQNLYDLEKRILPSRYGYFGGYLPDQLAVQYQLLDKIQDDVTNMHHYLGMVSGNS